MNIRTAALAAPLALATLASTPACYSTPTPEEKAAQLLKTTAPLRATSSKIIEGCKSVLAAEDVELLERREHYGELESPFSFDYKSELAGTCSRYLSEGGLDNNSKHRWVSYSSPEGKSWSMVLSPVGRIQAFPPGGTIDYVVCGRLFSSAFGDSSYSYKSEKAFSAKTMYLDDDEPCVSILKDSEDGLRVLRWQVYDLKNQ